MPRSTRIVLLLVAVGAGGGCRTFYPTKTLPIGNQVVRGQLVVHRNLQPASDDRLIDELVGMRHEIAAELGLPPVEDGPIEVYLFDDEVQYASFMAGHFPSFPPRRAFFVDMGDERAVYAHRNGRMVEDLRHEVAHGYLHAAVPGLPLWLDEGLAEYFEVSPHLAGINGSHLALLQANFNSGLWEPDLRRLESLTTVEAMMQQDYAESWAWVYWMLHHSMGSRELFVDHLQRRAAGEDVEPLSVGLRRLHFRPADTMLEFTLALRAPELSRR